MPKKIIFTDKKLAVLKDQVLLILADYPKLREVMDEGVRIDIAKRVIMNVKTVGSGK